MIYESESLSQDLMLNVIKIKRRCLYGNKVFRNISKDNQRNRHKKFDEDKIIYEPVYFSNLYSQDSSDFVYMFNGNYFNERIKGNFSEKLVDIFAIK